MGALLAADRAHGIIGGAVPEVDDHRFDAVCGHMRTSAWQTGTDALGGVDVWNDIRCSGTLIAPNLVLLANHCGHQPGGAWSVRCRRNPDGTVGHVDTSLPDHGASSFHHVLVDCYIPAGVIPHPDTGEPFFIDMLLAVLSEPVTHIAPMPIRFASPEELPAGMTIFIAGWGLTESEPFELTGQCPESVPHGQIKVAEQIIDSFSSQLLFIGWPSICFVLPPVPDGATGQGRAGDSGGAVLIPAVNCPDRFELVAPIGTSTGAQLLYFVQGLPNFPLPDPCPADLNSDGVIDGLDLGVLLASWSIPPEAPGCGSASPCRADMNCDSLVNGLDLGLLLAAWGTCPGQTASCGESMGAGVASQPTATDPFLDWALEASIEELFEWFDSTGIEQED